MSTYLTIVHSLLNNYFYLIISFDTRKAISTNIENPIRYYQSIGKSFFKNPFLYGKCSYDKVDVAGCVDLIETK